jgi:hypothetical protein
MSELAHPLEPNFLEIRSNALDDDPEDLKPIAEMMKRYSVNHRTWEHVGGFGKAIRNSTADDIIISDNNIENLNDLTSLEFPEIRTDGGTAAGLQILTQYHDQAEISSGLRVLFTQFTIEKKVAAQIKRMRTQGQNIYAFHKNNEDDLLAFEGVLRKFRVDRLKAFIMEKYRYVSDLFEEWGLSEDERAAFLGVTSLDDPVWKAMEIGTTSRDVETRCDLVYRMKENLSRAYGKKGEEVDPEQATAWLRTPITPLGSLSPIQFISDGYQHRLAELVFRMEGR